jgi:TRAP-type transport system periplasmic protein
VSLIIPFKIWGVRQYLTLWHYTIDPLILAVSGKTWAALSLEDQNVLRKAGQEIMEQQKRESREGLDQTSTLIEKLQDIYGMEVFHPSTIEIKAFRDKTRTVYAKWADEIGMELVRAVETTVESAK